MKKVLIDFHHTDLFRSFLHLFEKRFGWAVYRPCGHDWYYKGFYYHPILDEALGNLSPWYSTDRHSPHGVKSEEPYPADQIEDSLEFRWMTLEEASQIDLIVCSTDRNQHGFQKLKSQLGLKCPIIRYIGNVSENVDDTTFDFILPATLHYYDLYKDSRKMICLYHPEFDLNVYSWKEPTYEKPTVRTFLNFIWHDGSGSDQGLWGRYKSYTSDVGGRFITHGLGTPPPGIPAEKNKIIDIWFRENPQFSYLLNRKNWPPLQDNDGEPTTNRQIAELMSQSNLIWHVKRCDGYGFIIHKAAASGRPIICEQRNYAHLSARSFLQDGSSCVYITGDETCDRENVRKHLMNFEKNYQMCRDMHSRFHSAVSFNSEADKIREKLQIG